MFVQTKNYPVIATPELAMDTATHPKWKGERDLSKTRMAFLEGELEQGRFYSPTWVFATLNGKRYRVNGQHTSNLLANANGHFPKGLSVNIIEFHCESENDLAELFATFDRPESARSMRDIIGAHAAQHEGLAGISARNVARGTAGILFARRQTGQSKGAIGRDDRARLVHDHADYLKWVSPIIAIRPLDREAVAAAIFLSSRVDREAAMKFWLAVHDGSEQNHRGPSRVLQSFLLNLKIDERARGTNREQRWPPRAIFVKCIHAWNAWRRGAISDLKYYEGSPIPELV